MQVQLDSDRLRIGVALALIVLFVVFLAGAVWAKLELWPYGLIREAKADLHFLQETNGGSAPQFGVATFRSGEGVVENSVGQTWGDSTLVTTYEDIGPVVRLIAMDGAVINRWPVIFSDIWPDPSHVYPRSAIPQFRFGYEIHGLLIDRDASITAILGGLGIVRMDRCGNVQWTVDRRAHHAINRDVDGSYWALSWRDVRELQARPERERLWPQQFDGKLLPLTYDDSYQHFNDLLLHISPGGEVLEEISVLDAVMAKHSWPELFPSISLDSPPRDPLHANDVELVTPALAQRIEGVEAGDLLLGMRNINGLAVISRRTHQLVWLKRGPWVHQHDPVILPDGRISVYDNNANRFVVPNRNLPGSRILALAPDSNAITQVLPTPNPESYFYSQIMGRHQYLPNGNILVAEPLGGSALEFNPDGRIVWRYTQLLDDGRGMVLSEAQRFPEGYFTVTDWRCGPAA
ncbi:MAG: hypothetical protein GC189_11115 [Alphaproteobacteria bacterium]|nr:hypothetical protein [Alphaproteobacteria bacterium]